MREVCPQYLVSGPAEAGLRGGDAEGQHHLVGHGQAGGREEVIGGNLRCLDVVGTCTMVSTGGLGIKYNIVGLYELEAEDVAGHWVVEKVRSCYRRGRPRVSRRTG